MTGSEVAILLAILAVIGIFLFLVRRAADKQSTVRDRLEQPADAAEESRRLPTSEADDDEEEDEEPAEPADNERLRDGLARTRGGFVARLGKLFARKQIDADVLDELEQVLFTADIGPKTADTLFQSIKARLSKQELDDPEAVWSEIRERSLAILDVDTPPLTFSEHKPFVLLTIGVNGVGKTTTIGKLAAKLGAEGKRVLLGAGDTFRAAAVEQLQIWGERADAPVVTGKSGGDPSSVLFDTIKRGVDEKFDVVICDTAGRLHTKVDLMDELKKVGRVCEKAMPGAPHETWLVLDATTGQNAIQQAQMFKQAMNITGIVLTKLDGTAKGGVILGICHELAVPVRYIGIGESVSDLREFDARAFVDALYANTDAAEAA
ncbi:signal recognition particle-docking protein FtsY [Haliangium ochraceum]|uniref:Signal recognition particle receptor FtsY n=1 Tax=Haliangium ochraceum (strain DSM 14365 / JCM 11303 / SMP-2) TaxID=502025 RepID=D0LY50_HALO1|nr:signal recognition particle-docking protein FtsY [Haliangium ochraceum]ACY16200.1 signal recognition particle-docking protein FtsY [Haliangium ochraceum DSM 14365]